MPHQCGLCRRARGLEENDKVRIVRELADEGNSIAKIAFMTRLPESAVREALSLLAPCAKATPHPSRPGVSGQYFSPTQRASRWVTAGRPFSGPHPAGTWLRKKAG
jgi:hypothetical protein